MDLAETIQRLYDSEINCTITMLWDGGIDVGLVSYLEPLKRSRKMRNVRTAVEIAPALHEMALTLYPTSAYAKKYGPGSSA
jgi:hypothetical protein